MAKQIKQPKKLTKTKLKSMERTAKRKGLAAWSKEVRDRDGNKCAVCGKSEYLNAHHLIPKERFKQHQFDVQNGITLCPSCHKYGSYAFHRHALFSMKWMMDHRPEQYAYLITLMEQDLAQLANSSEATEIITTTSSDPA